MALQWTFRGRSTAEVLISQELPDSTGKTYYEKVANNRGKLLATFSTGSTDSGESDCFGQVSKLLLVFIQRLGATHPLMGAFHSCFFLE